MMTLNIANMLRPEVFDHPVKNIELIETHISAVILTGDYVYKIKKPVDFGFLDFSTLKKRHTCCLEELRLNRRMAPEIYLDVVAITGTPESPVIGGSGEVIEYAVKMAQFPQSAQLDHRLAAGQLKLEHMDAIAHMVADFHQRIDVADDTMDFGTKAAVYHPVDENFRQIAEHIDTAPYADTLDTLEQWSRYGFERLSPVFEQRKHDGFIRECHGDMHLRNMLWLDSAEGGVKGGEEGRADGGRPLAFDCIEFNANLRWIDVISEVAFLVMDLQSRQQLQLANRFLNSYLEATGDYAGVSVLPFYLCYRALVRAKVDALRLEQKNLTAQERAQSLAEFESYLELASGYVKDAKPKLIIMRGLSASGKSTVSQQLLDAAGMIRIRSDVERKRLFDIAASTHAADDIDTGIYTTQASEQTYAKLRELASQVISAGYSVIVDAAFLKYEQRQPFLQLAKSLAVPCIILEVTAPAEVLRQRIIARTNDVSDAGLAVLEHQLSCWQPLHQQERKNAVIVDTMEELPIELVIDAIEAD
jgi:aminoglycoside phosphotransferase family enzyme/predicted kinase